MLVGTISMVFILDWALGLVTLVGLGLVVTVDIFGSWRTFESFQEVQRLRGIVSGVAHESFDGALTVKSLGREGFETDRFRIASEHLRDNVIKVGRIWGTLRSVVESLPSVTIVALLVAGALRIRSGAIDAGELVTVAYLVSLASLPVRVLGYVLWDLAGSIASWRRIETVLETREFVRHGDEQAALEPGGAAVEGGDVAFSYDGVEPVLNDLQLDIPAGRTVAIVGPTGSGKSTLTLLLARLWDPATGRIELDGRDLRAFAHGALSREVAFVAQEAFLFDDDVRGNVTLGMRYDFEEVVEAARLAAADEFVRNLVDGHSTHLGERGTTLSGGQRQRIALARALVRRPRLLILDDATSAVDPSVETVILRGLKRAELPATVVIVANRRSSIILADDVVFMEGGRVVAHGSHEELLSCEPGYADLLEAYDRDAAERREERR